MFYQSSLAARVSDPVRVTATEMINGIKHLLVLEQDIFGRFREIQALPMDCERLTAPGLAEPPGMHRTGASRAPARV